MRELTESEWALIAGLVAKEYQNANRAQLRARTPIANEKAGVRVGMISRLMFALGSEQVKP